MDLKRFALSCFALACATPVFAFSDITVYNQTSAYITASVPMFTKQVCSDIAGDDGIATPAGTPGDTMIIPEDLFEAYCSKECNVSVYTSKSCEKNKAIAVVTFDPKKGVKSVQNQNTQGYVVSGSGFTVYIKGGPKASFFDMLFGR